MYCSRQKICLPYFLWAHFSNFTLVNTCAWNCLLLDNYIHHLLRTLESCPNTTLSVMPSLTTLLRMVTNFQPQHCQYPIWCSSSIMHFIHVTLLNASGITYYCMSVVYSLFYPIRIHMDKDFVIVCFSLIYPKCLRSTWHIRQLC